MRWQDERYVRVYTRDTPEWLSLSFLAQGLFVLLLRKVDRAGILPLGRLGKRGAVVAIGHGQEWGRLEAALEELLDDGCVIIEDNQLVVPNFLEAQDAPASDKLRQRESRAKARMRALNGGQESRNVTDEARNVTERHDETADDSVRDETSRDVTAGTARYGTVQHGTDRHGALDGTRSETAVSPPSAAGAGDLEAEAAAAPRLPPRPPGVPVRSVRVRRST